MERNRLTALLVSLRVSPDLVGELRSLLDASLTPEDLEGLVGPSSFEGRLSFEGSPGRATEPPKPVLPERYEERGLIGLGGMGEVYRVHDHVLQRVVALKLVRRELSLSPEANRRFVAEARATAQLSHPGIVPVHDHGVTPENRPYFTMQEVRGETFAARIGALHALPTDPRTDLRRLLDALARAAEAVGYAHARGIVHRDLKPANLLLGEHGEVRVVDWGLFRPDPAWDGPPVLVAAIAGTPAYMAPEQARGEVERIDARTDVYALGSVLWEALTGHPPFEGERVGRILERLASGETLPRPASPFTGVDEIVELAVRCTQPAQEERPAEARLFAAGIRRWLDGQDRRDRARQALAAAHHEASRLDRLALRAATARAQAHELLAATEPWQPDTAREPFWAAEDEAQGLERELRDTERAIDDAFEAALTHDPDDVELRAAATARARRTHESAEARGDSEAASVAELRLKRHAQSLPEGNPERIRATRWLAGDGALTLKTEPDGARATLFRYETVRKRLVPIFQAELGCTPLLEVALPRGRWLVRLELPDRPPVGYPVAVGREEHWHGVPPGESEPLPILLPELSELGSDECYVPAGWCQIGGDPDAPSGLSARRVWVDALVVRRFVVTNAEWLAFVNERVAQGDVLGAERVAPRERGRGAVWGALLYGRGEDGRFALPIDSDGSAWQDAWPAVMIDHAAAWMFARWEAARTGLPWRLPAEMEWEKAARGVDGRIFPWGDHVNPVWCGTRLAHRGASQLEEVQARPTDESPYGVRGLAGQVVEWTADSSTVAGTVADGERVHAPDGSDDTEEAWMLRTATHRIVGRGGSWLHDLKSARAASRLAVDPWSRASNVGVRLVRSFHEKP